ncbi:MAG: PAS domain S-box protein [Candidatus Cloacimonadota bacterium]|nr:PAS domain S-box protein [Candidatus Cloacimonadota bacterium]
MKEKLKILILEDDSNDVDLLVNALRNSDFNFVYKHVEGENNFLRGLKDFKPDIILSDYSMPQFDGLDALYLAKKESEEIPFIIVTGSVNEETAVKCMREGAWDYVIKEHMSRVPTAVNNALKLKEEKDKEKKSVKKVKYLNSILLAIRNVSQLIFREKDKNTLIKKSCQMLAETRGFSSSWIVLFDENKKIAHWAQFGLGDGFGKLIEEFKVGKYNYCSELALKERKLIILKAEESLCKDCPLFHFRLGIREMAIPLEYQNKIYGLLAASVPDYFVIENEERELFKEVAGDIAFALHNMEVKEEIKKGEKALRIRDANFLDIFQNIDEGIAYTTLKGKVISVNKSFEKILNISADEIVGKNIITLTKLLLSGKMIKTVLSNLREILQGKKIEPFEVEYKNKILEVTSNFNSNSGRITGVIRDVTESRLTHRELKAAKEELEANFEQLKANEQDLIDSEERYRTLIEDSPLAIIVHVKGKIAYVNPLAEKLFGLDQEDKILGRSIMDYIHPDYHKIVGERVQKMYKQKEQPAPIELQFLRTNGDIIDVEISPKLIFYKGQQATLIIINDITERKQAEEKLKKKNLELEIFNKMAVGRELKMIELKKEINEFLEKLGKKPKYKIAE